MRRVSIRSAAHRPSQQINKNAFRAITISLMAIEMLLYAFCIGAFKVFKQASREPSTADAARRQNVDAKYVHTPTAQSQPHTCRQCPVRPPPRQLIVFP